MDKNRLVLVASIVIVALALFFGLWIHGHEMAQSRTASGLTVTGSIKKMVDSDLAKWNSSFTLKADTKNLKNILDQSEFNADKLKGFITKLGLIESDINFLPVQTNPIYEQLPGYGYTQNIIGYNVIREFYVQSKDISKIESLANQYKNIIDLGIVPDYQRTEYFYTGLADLRPVLFADATKDAESRARAIAQGTGNKIGSLINAKTGVIQILPPNSLDIADYGAYDLSTKQKEITATITATFQLK
ncbi:MAG TPA: SIMPL domain-containing protein [bacterium]|nr:SIMPL domain-containing protein [bacterium]